MEVWGLPKSPYGSCVQHIRASEVSEAVNGSLEEEGCDLFALPSLRQLEASETPKAGGELGRASIAELLQPATLAMCTSSHFDERYLLLLEVAALCCPCFRVGALLFRLELRYVSRFEGTGSA